MAFFDTRRTTSVQLAHASAMVAGTLLLLPATGLAAPGEPRVGSLRQFKLDNPDLSRREFRREFRLQRAFNTSSNLNSSGLNANPANSVMQNHELFNTPREQRKNAMVRIANQSSQITDSGHVLEMNKGVDIDLSSIQQNITLGEKLFKNTESVTIVSGGEEKTFSAGSKVTAAEYIACKQMLLSGKQTVQLDGSGRAIGGEVDLSALTSRGDKMRVDDLFIPTNLVTYGDVSKRATFQVTGDLINAGSMYVYSSSKNINRGFLKADNITNEETGLLSTVLPDGMASEHGSAQSNVDLDIQANGTLTNHGVIESSGGLNLTADDIINAAATPEATKPVLKAIADLNISAPYVVNNGLIQSTNANVSIDNPIGTELSIQNSGGVISAVNGSINLRTPAYNGTANTYLTGGDLLSKSLNIHAGQGTADIDVNELTGIVNETGLASHVKASTETLNLGTICLTGDPTYKNDSGSIVFSGDITVGEALTVIASQHIINNAPVTITAGNANTGFPITLIAGADITSGGTDTSSIPTGNAGTATTISGFESATGGNIVLSSLGAGSVTINARGTNTKANANGANIFLVAYNNSMGTAGVVTLTGSFLNSGGRGTGSNGDITILADGRDAAPLDAIHTGTLNATGGSGGGGSIVVNCIQPSTTLGGSVTYNADGTLMGTNQITAGTVVQNNASVRVDGNLTAYTSIDLRNGGGNNDLIDIKGGITLKTLSPSGTVSLRARFGSDLAQGAGSLISTQTLDMNTSTGGFGTSTNPITTNAKYIVIDGSNLVTNVFLDDTNTQIVNLDVTALALNMRAAGNIVSAASGAITVANLNLLSTGGSIGLTKDIPLETDSFTLQLAAKGDVFVHNNYNGTTALNGPNSAGGTYSVSTNGNITSNPGLAITAPKVDLKTAGGFQAVFNPIITATKSISLTSVLNISNAFVNTANMTTPLLVLTSSNNIGSSALNRFTIAANIGGVKATAMNTFLNATGVSKKGFNLAGAQSDEFDLLSAGSVNVTGDVNTTTNDIRITTATGFISVKPSVKLISHQNLSLQVTDTSLATAAKSKIILGKGAELQTLAATAGLGDIVLSIGTLSFPVVGTAPTKSFAYAENNGKVYFGAGGITAKSSLNTMYAKGANIIINNPFKATNISLAGNVKIIADPPVASEDFVWIGSTRNETGSAIVPVVNLDSAAMLGLTGETTSTALINTNPTINSDLSQMISTRSTHHFAPLNITLQSALTALNTASNVEDDSVITTYGAPTGLVSSTLCAENELGNAISDSQRFSPLQACVELKSGHSVFVATQDTELTTSFGKVTLKKGSVVLVSNQDTSLSIYNLHDNRKNSVAVKLRGQEYSLAPGQHLTIASTRTGDYTSVNAIEAIAHRSLKSKTIDGGISIFTSEFFVPTAIDSVSSLKSITSSSHPQIKKIKDKMIKTAAVLMYLGGSQSDFRTYTHPQITALNPKF